MDVFDFTHPPVSSVGAGSRSWRSDLRRESPTFGCVNEFMLGERNQGLVVIPPGVYHGWKNIGADEAAIISMPSQLYEYENPDRWELPWDSTAAREIIAYQWPVT
jgi:dTDP-4-dehydrorhamnose 3,5-epimerase